VIAIKSSANMNRVVRHITYKTVRLMTHPIMHVRCADEIKNAFYKRATENCARDLDIDPVEV
jgi:hypothetical protein